MKQQDSDNNGVYLWGAALGLGLGLVTAHFYKQTLDEEGATRKGLSAREAITVGVAVLGVVRQITEMGSNKGKKSG